MARKTDSRRKRTIQLSKAQKGMRLLGIFHYILGILLLLMLILLGTLGPVKFWEAIQARNSIDFAFLDQYDPWVAGMSILTLIFLQAAIELFVGWSCRRKSTRPQKLLLTLILSGISTLTNLFTFIKAGADPIAHLDPAYALLINLITFVLAFLIRREYSRSSEKQSEAGSRFPEVLNRS